MIDVIAGTEVAGIADRFGRQIDDAIWGEIAREEAAIRADPQATRDPVLIAVFGQGSRI